MYRRNVMKNKTTKTEKNKVLLMIEKYVKRLKLKSNAEMKERLFTGQLNALKNSVSIPGKVTFGYKAVIEPITKKKKWELSENSDLVQNIFNWYEYGLPNGNDGSTNNIAKYCIKKNLHPYTHSKRNIGKLLSEKAYTGRKEFHFKKQKERITISYPQIISSEQFQRVQELKKKANTTKDKSRHTTILSSLIRCTECKTFLTANYRLKGVYDSSSYRCGARSKAIPCGNKNSISVNMIDSAVWSLLKSSGSVRKNINTEDYERIYTETEREMYKINQDINNIGKIISNLKSITNSLSTIASIDDIQVNENYQEIGESTEELSNKLISYEALLDKKIAERNKINLKLEELEKKISLISNFELETDVDYQDDENTKNEEPVESSNKSLKIEVMEKSKSEVKKYINHFIKEISIIFHSKKTTVAEISFNHPLFFELWNSDKFEDYFQNDSVHPESVYLIIDKNDTNRLKLFWCRKFSQTKIHSQSITTRSKDSIQTMSFDFNDFHSKSKNIVAKLDKFFFNIQYHPLKLR